MIAERDQKYSFAILTFQTCIESPLLKFDRKLCQLISPAQFKHPTCYSTHCLPPAALCWQASDGEALSQLMCWTLWLSWQMSIWEWQPISWSLATHACSHRACQHHFHLDDRLARFRDGVNLTHPAFWFIEQVLPTLRLSFSEALDLMMNCRAYWSLSE